MTNQAICLARTSNNDPAYYDFIFREKDRVPANATWSSQGSVIWQSLIRIAYFGIKKYKQSLNHSNAAQSFDPSSDAYSFCLRAIQDLQVDIEEDQEIDRLGTSLMVVLLACLSSTLLGCPLTCSSIKTADTESAVLQAWRYTGSLLE